MDMPSEIQHQAMGYDRTATMFSPDGHLLQVEYAEKTVRLGSSSIGIVCKDGVVIVSDRRVNDKVRVVAQQHKVTYDSSVDVEEIIREIANTKQMFTQYGGARPYGVAILVAGIDNQG